MILIVFFFFCLFYFGRLANSLTCACVAGQAILPWVTIQTDFFFFSLKLVTVFFFANDFGSLESRKGCGLWF